MTPAALLLLALVANYLPELIVSVGGGSLAAWFVVADNLQIAALWWAAAWFAERLPEANRALVLPSGLALDWLRWRMGQASSKAQCRKCRQRSL